MATDWLRSLLDPYTNPSGGGQLVPTSYSDFTGVTFNTPTQSSVTNPASDVQGQSYTGTGNLMTRNGVTTVAPAMQSLLALRQQLGVPILGNIDSSYRTYAQQQALYNAYLNGTGNLAAKPGTSNHETGTAIDINSGFLASHPEVRSWLASHGWANDVGGEAWHWHWTG